ncbi:hypothetical protein [Modestobacter sp. SYSU DS0657]
MTPTAPVSPAALLDHFAASAAEVDDGTRDVRDGLRWLGQRGLFAPAADRATRVGRAVESLRAVATASLADAFAAWSQTMVVEYLTCCPPDPASAVLDDLVAARRPGATGLAPAIDDVAGGPPVPVLAEPAGDGWALTGPVRWASNLFPGALLVVPARTADGGRMVAAVRLDAPGVRVAPARRLLALDATGTSSVELAQVPVAGAAVLTRDLAGFLALCRPTMVVTQAALALGVADAALASTADALDGPAAVLGPDHHELTARRDAVAAELTALAADLDAAGPRDVARARLRALELATRAVEVEGLARGGTAFAAASPTSRRRREAAFLPLQAPSLVQLRAAASGAGRP